VTNVVVLRGRLTRPAALRSLPSGDQLLALELSIQREGERADTAPVVWPDAPAAATALDVDQEVLVVGRVRRRFFRAGGSTQSRTEVVADVVVPAGQTRRAKAALAKALSRLEEEVEHRRPAPPRAKAG
jgi:single-strand DNA-binding protein